MLSAIGELVGRLNRTAKVPLLLQAEAAECGHVCVAMLAHYWGCQIDVAQLRERNIVSLRGTTLEALLRQCQELGLAPRPLRLELGHLRSLQVPAILHWDLVHFVVLVKVARDHVVIHDPAIGRRKLELAEVSKHFTGIAIEARPTPAFCARDERSKRSIWRVMGRTVGLRRGLIQLFVLGVLAQAFVLSAPLLLRWSVDDAINWGRIDILRTLATGFLLLVLCHGATLAVRGWVTATLSVRVKFQWISNVFGHLVRLPLRYFENRHAGDIISRFGSITTVQRSITSQFVEGIVDGILAVGTLVFMAHYSLQLMAIGLVAVVCYAGVRLLLHSKHREATNEQILCTAQQNSHFIETVRGIQSLRLFNREEARSAAWLALLSQQFNAETRVIRLGVVQQASSFLTFAVERVIVVFLAGTMVVDGVFSLGVMFAYLAYREQFMQSATSLIDKLFELQMLNVHAERVSDIVFTEREQSPSATSLGRSPNEASLAVRNVSFRYSENDPVVVSGVSLEVAEGDFVAITGASGSGKTTLAKIILGLIPPTHGEILVSGLRATEVHPAALRALFGTVMQEDRLFAGTIADNISFFSAEQEPHWIEDCARAAAIHDDIFAMPMRYNTVIGDLGSGLSGGQRQRIMLARALHARPRILLLDEATSHLDPRNERLVGDAVKKLKLTRIVIAHRAETVALADRVITLRQGRVVGDINQRSTLASPPRSAAEPLTGFVP